MHIWSISSALRSQNQKNIYCTFRILSDLHVNKQRKVDEDIDRDTEVKTNLLYKFHWSFQYLLVLENISAYQGKIVSFVTLSFWSLMLQVFTMLWNNLQFTWVSLSGILKFKDMTMKIHILKLKFQNN